MPLKRIWVLGMALTIAACERASTDPGSITRAATLPGGQTGSDTAGTSQPHSTEPVASVAVTLAALSGGREVQVGDSLGFSAVLKDALGVVVTGRSVTWASSNENAVRIEGSFGDFSIARAKGAGSATVTATSEGKSGSVGVTVK